MVAPAFGLPVLTGIRPIIEQKAELDEYLVKLEQQEVGQLGIRVGLTLVGTANDEVRCTLCERGSTP